MTATMQRPSGGNPPIITADDLLKKMRAGTKETFEIRMRELIIPVRILAQDEWNLIRKDAKTQTQIEGGDDTDMNVKIQKSVLKFASTVNGGAPLLGDKILSKLNQDEMRYLYDEYLRQVDTINPNIEQMTTDEFRILVDGIKKNTILSRDCSLVQLKAIFSAFQEWIQAVELKPSQPDKSSGGQPPIAP